MRTAWLVARHEYRTLVMQRRFLFTLLSVPLAVLVLVGVGLLLQGGQEKPATVLGYVDEAGLLDRVEGVGDGAVRWVRYDGPTQAREALSSGAIQAYFILPHEYAVSGVVQLVHRGEVEGNPAAAFADLLRVGLLAEQPAQVVQRLVVNARTVVQLPNGRQFAGGLNLGDLVPMMSGLLLTALIMVGSGYLLQAVAGEKANRTMEILMTSVSPVPLMTGKVIGTVALILTLLLAWSTMSGLGLWAADQLFDLAWLHEVQLEVQPLILTAALILPTFLAVAALMTAAGAMLDERAGNGVTAVFTSFFMVALGSVMPLLGDLNSGPAVVFSLLPFVSAVFMPLRAVYAQVPTWQLAAAILIQCLVALGGLWLAARSVRLGMLRYGRSLGVRELLGLTPAGGSEPRRTALRTGRGGAQARIQKKTWVILRHEMRTVLAQPYLILMTVGVPLLVVGQMWLFQQVFDGRGPAGADPLVVDSDTSLAEMAPSVAVGYVDKSGLIQRVPAEIPAGGLVAYPDETSAAQALEEGRIESYTIIPADYIAGGEMVQVQPEYSPLSSPRPSEWLRWAILVNLTGGDTELAARVWHPMTLEVTDLAPGLTPEQQAAAADDMEDQARITLMLIVLLFYAIIVLSAGLLLRSVSEEKKNRVIEVLLNSCRPIELLTGKIVALGLVGALQTIGMGLIGYLLLKLSGMVMQLPADTQFSPATLAWMGVFLILGYAFNAALMGGAGAMVPNWRESSMVTLVLILPAFVGFEITLWQTDPHSTLMTAGSLFPLTSPLVMIKRLMHGGVPAWQLVTGAVLLLGTSWLILRAVARMFRAQYLLSGAPFSYKRYFGALLHG